MLREADILDALRACYDASHRYKKPVNIVDLGLVESVALMLDEEAPGAGIAGVPSRYHLTVTLLSPTPDEAAQAQLAALIVNRMAGLPEIWRTEVHFDPRTQWTPARIRPEGRQLLGLDFPILNNKR